MARRKKKGPTERYHESADGVRWLVEVTNPGSSNALVRFRHPDGTSSANDRYGWYITHGPEARSVTSRLDKRKVLDSLTDEDISRLFRRSMPVTTSTDHYRPTDDLGEGGLPAVRASPRAIGPAK